METRAPTSPLEGEVDAQRREGGTFPSLAIAGSYPPPQPSPSRGEGAASGLAVPTVSHEEKLAKKRPDEGIRSSRNSADRRFSCAVPKHSPVAYGDTLSPRERVRDAARPARSPVTRTSARGRP